jgi:spermidine synthase
MKKFVETAPSVAVEYQYEVEKVLYEGKTSFQKIMVFKNPYFGNILVLDGIVQTTERDEFFYHEMLTHVLAHAHPEPRRVVVIGGGDGGTVREVAKHKCVEKIYFVELDPEVIRVSREFFPTISSALDDPRVEIKNMDGAEFIKGAKDIDLVLIDSTDPIGFAEGLYKEEFFKSINNAMAPDGMCAIQTDSLLLNPGFVAEAQETLKRVFPVVDLFTVPIATYPGNWWTFSVGSKMLEPREMRRKFELDSRYYSEEIHSYSFVPRGLYGRLMGGKLDW